MPPCSWARVAAMKRFCFHCYEKKKFLSISCINPQEEICFLLICMRCVNIGQGVSS